MTWSWLWKTVLGPEKKRSFLSVRKQQLCYFSCHMSLKNCCYCCRKIDFLWLIVILDLICHILRPGWCVIFFSSLMVWQEIPRLVVMWKMIRRQKKPSLKIAWAQFWECLAWTDTTNDSDSSSCFELQCIRPCLTNHSFLQFQRIFRACWKSWFWYFLFVGQNITNEHRI